MSNSDLRFTAQNYSGFSEASELSEVSAGGTIGSFPSSQEGAGNFLGASVTSVAPSHESVASRIPTISPKIESASQSVQACREAITAHPAAARLIIVTAEDGTITITPSAAGQNRALANNENRATVDRLRELFPALAADPLLRYQTPLGGNALRIGIDPVSTQRLQQILQRLEVLSQGAQNTSSQETVKKESISSHSITVSSSNSVSAASSSSLLAGSSRSDGAVRIEPSTLPDISIPLETFRNIVYNSNPQVEEYSPLMPFQQEGGLVSLQHDSVVEPNEAVAKNNYACVVASFINALGNEAVHFSPEQRAYAREGGLTLSIMRQVFKNIAAGHAPPVIPEAMMGIDMNAFNPLHTMTGLFNTALLAATHQAQLVGTNATPALHRMNNIPANRVQDIVRAINWAVSYRNIRSFATAAITTARHIPLENASRATSVVYQAADLTRRIVIATAHASEGINTATAEQADKKAKESTKLAKHIENAMPSADDLMHDPDLSLARPLDIAQAALTITDNIIRNIFLIRSTFLVFGHLRNNQANHEVATLVMDFLMDLRPHALENFPVRPIFVIVDSDESSVDSDASHHSDEV